jgi:DNA-binding transcriptional ArsR family regulator
MQMNEDTKRQTDMKNAALRAADVLRGLANSDRLLLMCQLSQGEANVSELEAAVGITQPTLSQQLGVMRRLKLVETRRAGKMVYYRIGDNRIMTLLNTLYIFTVRRPGQVKETITTNNMILLSLQTVLSVDHKLVEAMKCLDETVTGKRQ